MRAEYFITHLRKFTATRPDFIMTTYNNVLTEIGKEFELVFNYVPND